MEEKIPKNVHEMNMDADDDDGSYYGSCYGYEDLTFLEACIEQDVEAVQAILDENPTEEEINERDRSGRTGLSHTCAHGVLPVLDMLAEIPEVDPNIPDKEGNTPLIFSSQAGHTDVVRILLQDFKIIRIDQQNKLGFTALMKSAIQGRTDCARLLLYAGADPKLRDHGRKLCAEEWARFVGRKECAESIAKFSNTKRFCLKSRLNQNVERCSSVPDLASDQLSRSDSTKQSKKRRGGSLRRKLKNILPHNTESLGINLSSPGSPFAVIARCVSTPVLPGVISPVESSSLRRPVSADNIPRVEITVPMDEDGTHVETNMIARRKAAKRNAQQDYSVR
ncbi:uncharacterized protein [Haliotis asinina]|uniref:uncharacterized protein n=1 Tax=Haliotis asinina TaxID=109174 RepID=UPI003531ED63